MNARGLEIVRNLIKDVASAAYMQIHMAEILMDSVDDPEMHKAVLADVEVPEDPVATSNFINYLAAGTLYQGLKEFERIHDLLESCPELAETVDPDFPSIVATTKAKHIDYLNVHNQLISQGADLERVTSLCNIHNPMSLILVSVYSQVRNCMEQMCEDSDAQETA